MMFDFDNRDVFAAENNFTGVKNNLMKNKRNIQVHHLHPHPKDKITQQHHLPSRKKLT